MFWDAACSIRGEKDAAKFKDYPLPLLFLKHLSDVFDDGAPRRGVWRPCHGSGNRRKRSLATAILSAARSPVGGDQRARALRACGQTEPLALGRHRRGGLRRRAQRRARHQPGQAARRGGDLLRPALPPGARRRAVGLLRSRLRIPAAQVRRRPGPERGRVLHSDRGRLSDDPHPVDEAGRDLSRLRLRLGRPADQAPARRLRTRPDQPRRRSSFSARSSKPRAILWRR